MKTLFVIISVFLISLNLKAQSTYVPDDNFEQALINQGYDTVLDNYVLTANIRNITNLDVSYSRFHLIDGIEFGIRDLTGIEDFIALEDLYCNNNNIQNLDLRFNVLLENLYCEVNDLTSLSVSSNLELKNLNCRDNELTSLNVFNNNKLAFLYCYNNEITSLNLENNTNLFRLRCGDNNLTYLNVKNGNNTNMYSDSLFGFEAVNNPNLLCIQVDNVSYSEANWTHIDNQSFFSRNCGVTYVPDDNFEQALINQGYDTVLDNYVLTSSMESIRVLNVSNLNIADLTGIEDMISLESLNCSNNNLIFLQLPENSLASNTTISCSNNTNLETIDFGAFAGNLQFLYCSNTNISSLDMEGFKKLELLEISNNQSLINFRLFRNMVLGEEPTVIIDAKNNPLLASVQCEQSLVSDLDVSNNPSLRSVYCPSNFIRSLNVNNTSNLVTIECQNFINVPGNSSEFLKGPLTELNLSTSPKLGLLDCRNNRLVNLNISNNPELSSLECDNNSLEILKINNGNNSNIGVITATKNTNLNCVQVDDAQYSNDNWLAVSHVNSQFDEGVSFSERCNYIYTPIIDIHFEQELIDLGIDFGPIDHIVLTKSISNITKLDVSGKGIKDLTGIEDFVALKELKCDKNNLKNLDLSSNKALKYLICNNNSLESLNIKNGNNKNFAVINTTNNTGLTCIKVDNASYSYKYWTKNKLSSKYNIFDFDKQNSFSEACIFLDTKNKEFANFKLYPNPVSNILNVNSDVFIDKITVTNLMGDTVLTTKKTELNLNFLPSGMYFLKIQSGSNTSIERIFKE